MIKVMELNPGDEFPANYSALTAILRFSTTSVVDFVNADYSSYKMTFSASQIIKLRNVHIRDIICVSGAMSVVVVDKGEEIDLRYVG
ncbi:MAG: hypothetical protein QW478_04165 [Candidatus Micrarchaeaceae archaeon]